MVERLKAGIKYALRLPCSEDAQHGCTGTALVAHHRGNSTTRRDLAAAERGGGGTSEVMGPGVMSCFVHHLRGRLGEYGWRVVLVGRNFDVKKSVVVDAEEGDGLGRLVGEIRGKLNTCNTRVFLVDVAVQGSPEAVFDSETAGARRREPLFAFWSREAISRMLFSGRCLDCYGQYFTVDLAGYKGPSGLARLGDVKAYSTMFRLLTVGAEKVPVGYQGIASQLLKAIPEGLAAVEQVAAGAGRRLSEEVGKLVRRLADLVVEATVLSDIPVLGSITVLDRGLLERFFAYQLSLVAGPLDRKLVESPASLMQQPEAGRVLEELRRRLAGRWNAGLSVSRWCSLRGWRTGKGPRSAADACCGATLRHWLRARIWSLAGAIRWTCCGGSKHGGGLGVISGLACSGRNLQRL